VAYRLGWPAYNARRPLQEALENNWEAEKMRLGDKLEENEIDIISQLPDSEYLKSEINILLRDVSCFIANEDLKLYFPKDWYKETSNRYISNYRGRLEVMNSVIKKIKERYTKNYALFSFERVQRYNAAIDNLKKAMVYMFCDIFVQTNEAIENW
jgi:hypothetical protein